MPEMTAEAFLHYPRDGQRRELVRGEVRTMSPAGIRHGRIAMRRGGHLEQVVRRNGLGDVFAAETGFKIKSKPDTVRAPDVSFVAEPRATQLKDVEGFSDMAPDLVVEVLSPDDRRSAINEKIEDWLRAGTRAVIVVEPRKRATSVHLPDCEPIELRETEVLSVPSIVPGWEYPLSELFE